MIPKLLSKKPRVLNAMSSAKGAQAPSTWIRAYMAKKKQKNSHTTPTINRCAREQVQAYGRDPIRDDNVL
jgi:hypothetical protein